MPLGNPPPQDQGYPQPMVRPDGTGDPSQQELDQAFPPQPQRQPVPPQRLPQPQPSTPPPDPLQPRPGTS